MGYNETKSPSFRRGSEEVMNLKTLLQIWCGFYCFLLSGLILFCSSNNSLLILFGFLGYFCFSNFPMLLIETFKGKTSKTDKYVLRHL